MAFTLGGSGPTGRQVPKKTSITQAQTPCGAGESWPVPETPERGGSRSEACQLETQLCAHWLCDSGSYLPEPRVSPLPSGHHGDFCCWVVAKTKYLCLYACVYI